MNTLIDYDRLLRSIKDTEAHWKKAKKDEIVKRRGYYCPLCLFIRGTFKTPFDKASTRGTCVLCPVKFCGFFHICTGIRYTFEDINDTTNEEFENLRTLVISRLKDLYKQLSKVEEFEKYNEYLANTRSTPVLGKKTKILKSKRPDNKKRRIVFKV